MNDQTIYDARSVREYLAFKRAYDIQWQAINNGASRLSGRERGVDQEVYWIGIDVGEAPLVIWSDTLRLSEGDYDIDVFRAPDGFTDGEEGVKRCLCGAGDPTEATLYMDVTPVDEETHETILTDFRDAGQAQGAGRPAAAPVSDAAFQRESAHLLIRITRQGSGAYAVSYRVECWDEAT